MRRELILSIGAIVALVAAFAGVASLDREAEFDRQIAAKWARQDKETAESYERYLGAGYYSKPCALELRRTSPATRLEFLMTCLRSVELMRHRKRETIVELFAHTAPTLLLEAESARALGKASSYPVRSGSADEVSDGEYAILRYQLTHAYEFWRARREALDDPGRAMQPSWQAEFDSVCTSTRDCSTLSATMIRLSTTLLRDAEAFDRMRKAYEELSDKSLAEHDTLFRRSFEELSYTGRSILIAHAAAYAKADFPAYAVDPDAKSPFLDALPRTAATVDFPATALVLRRPGLASSTPSNATGTDFEPYCTGTLVTPGLVLTAAHCVCGVSTTSDLCKRRMEEVGIRRHPSVDGDSYRIFFQGIGPRRVASGGITIHPSYASYRLFDDGTWRSHADLALLELATPTFEVKPASVVEPRAALLKEDPAVLVGFGGHWKFDTAPVSQSAQQIATMGSGIKLHALASVKSARGDLIRWSGPFNSPNVPPDMLGNACQGDSGGPLFSGAWQNSPKLSNGSLRLMGVTAFGLDTACVKQNKTFWTDLRFFHEWLTPLLRASEARLTAKGPDARFRRKAIFNTDCAYYANREKGVLSVAAPMLSVPFQLPQFAKASRFEDQCTDSQAPFIVTVNATCTAANADRARLCSATELSLTITGPDKKVVCAQTARSVVLACAVAAGRDGDWQVDVVGFRNPVAGVKLADTQEIQVSVTPGAAPADTAVADLRR